MAERHEVKFSVPNRELGNNDIVFKAWDRLDDAFIGELRVSVGGVEWRGSRQRRTYTYRMNWTEFDDLLFKCASRRRRSPKAAEPKRAPRRRTKPRPKPRRR